MLSSVFESYLKNDSAKLCFVMSIVRPLAGVTFNLPSARGRTIVGTRQEPCAIPGRTQHLIVQILKFPAQQHAYHRMGQVEA